MRTLSTFALEIQRGEDHEPSRSRKRSSKAKNCGAERRLMGETTPILNTFDNPCACAHRIVARSTRPNTSRLLISTS